MSDNMTIKFIYHNHIEFERRDAFTAKNLYEKYFGRLSVEAISKWRAGRAVILKRGVGVSVDCEISPWITNSCVTPPIISTGKKDR